MAEDRNTYADVWDQLDPKWAERVRVTDAATLGDEEIVRRWPQIGEGYLSKCMKALSLFTDSSNSKPQLWVNNPIVGREVFPGVYRLVTVDVDVMKSGLKGIIQTLRKGFNTTANWSEARLDEFEQGPANNVAVAGVSGASDNPTKTLKVIFPNCSPDHARAIAVSLATATHSNVVVRGETYTGAWNAIWAASKIEEDGSATITLFLALAQYNLVSYSDFATERQQEVVYLYDVPKPAAQTIIDAWKTVHPVGSSATANYSRTSGFVDLTLRAKSGDAIEFDFGDVGEDCRYTESQIAIFGTKVIESYPIPSVIDGIGISYKRDVRSNGDGTFDIFLTKKEAKYRNATGLVIEQNAAETTTQQQQLGLTTQQIASMAEEAGKIKTQRVDIRDDCSKDVVTNVEEGKEQVTTEKTVARSYEEETVETTYQVGELPLPSQESSKIKTVRNTPSKYVGRWNVLERIRTLLHLPSAVRYDVADDDSAHAEATEDINVPNSGGAAVELTAGAGESLSATVQYNKESDTLDVRKVVEEGKEMVSGSTEESAASKTVVEDKTFQGAEIAAVPAAGEIVRVDNRKSKYGGKYDTRKSVETGKPQESASIVDAAGFSETTTEKTVQAAPAPIPSATPGHIRTSRTSASKYKDRYDTVETDREVKPLDSVAKGGSALYDEETTTNQNAATDQSGGASGGEGEIIDRSSRKNDAGRFDNTTSKRTAKPFGPKIDVHGTPLFEETTELFRNQDALPSPGVPADGTTVDVAGSINEAAKLDYSKTTRRAIPREVLDIPSGEDELKSEETDIHVNKDSISVARAAGEVVDANIRISEFGKLDGTVRRTTAKPVVTGPYTADADGYKQTLVTKYENADSIPSASGKGERVDAKKNEFGKINAVKTVVSATEFYIDYNVPAASGRSPSFSRLYFGIEDSATIQAHIQEFFATVNAVTTEQYAFSCSVSRDGDGFYQLNMSANPKQSGGGSSDWDDGFNFTMPSMKPASAYATTSAVITYTSNRIKVQSLLTPTPELTNACYSGAGGGTSVLFLGRGRYKVTITTGTGTP